MISAEAPILFAKGCDIFITELTMRAWIHAEENKRRTLQRSDIASALMKSDMFDFLIDIVPREEAASHKRSGGQSSAAAAAAAQASAAVPPGQPHQQTGMHPPPPQMPPDYGMGAQMQHPGEEYQQPGVQNVYGAPPGMQAQGAPYGHHAQGGQMFGGDVYGYGMGQQQVGHLAFPFLLPISCAAFFLSLSLCHLSLFACRHTHTHTHTHESPLLSLFSTFLLTHSHPADTPILVLTQ